MNPWLERLVRGWAQASPVAELTEEEARLVLELAGAAAHTSGSRPLAPLAAYLAGQAVAGRDPASRAALLRAAVVAAGAAGPSGAGEAAAAPRAPGGTPPSAGEGRP